MSIYVVSLAVGLLSLVLAGLIATVGGMAWPRAVVALTLTGSAGLLSSTLGPTIRDAVGRADAAIGSILGRFTGLAVTGLLGILVVGFLALRVLRNVIDSRTIAAAAATPPVVALIPGVAGSIATTVVGIVPWLVTAVFSLAFGIR